MEGANSPAFTEGGGQGLEDATLFGRGNLRQNGREARLFLDDQTLERETRIGAAQLWLQLKQIVAADDELESHRRTEALIPARSLLDRVEERLQLLLRLLEFGVQLDDLVKRSGLLLWLPGLIEKGEQFIGAGDRRRAELDWVVLSCRDKKGAIFFPQFLGRVPPALEFLLSENVAQQPTADLGWRRLAAEALENVAHHGGGVSLQQDFQSGKVVRFPGREKGPRDRGAA